MVANTGLGAIEIARIVAQTMAVIPKQTSNTPQSSRPAQSAGTKQACVGAARDADQGNRVWDLT